MLKIALIDITVSDTNLGNEIIFDAASRHLRCMFPHAFFVRVPCAEAIGNLSRGLIRDADLAFLCGSNALTSHAWFFRPWRIGLRDFYALPGKVVALGAGWLRYEGRPDVITATLYRRLFSRVYAHSVRDGYARAQLARIGLEAMNTGCPSLWDLTPEHFARVPTHKGEHVLMTMTYYRANKARDRFMFDVLRRSYSRIFFWAQQAHDYEYAKELIGLADVECIDPSLEAVDSLLASKMSLDYVGTRLHAYIRAVHHRRRAVCISVDLRAIEMGRDFNLTTLSGNEIATLPAMLSGEIVTDIRVPQADLQRWKDQFRTFGRGESLASGVLSHTVIPDRDAEG